MRRASYTIMNSTAARLTIRDDGPWDQHPTVTNAAEDVVRELIESGDLKPGQRLFYYDSEGEYDELLVHNGHFAGFAPGPRTTV